MGCRAARVSCRGWSSEFSLVTLVTLVTLGVADIERVQAFYGQLGWDGQEIEETVFFQAGGIGVVLWSREKVALDAGVADAGAGRFDFGGA
jgi:uncharacterized protein